MILCILIEIFSPAHAKAGKKDLNVFKFGTFVGRFPSDGAASVEVKGLKGNRSADTRLPENAEDVQTFVICVPHPMMMMMMK